MSSTIPFTGRRAWTRSIQSPLRSVSAARFLASVITSVSKRPIWLVEAACPVTAAPPTTQRIAGSCASRSASFMSSYPAKRPNTDWRNWPSRVWRPFAPVRVSVRTSPAVSLRPRTSSSSRQASRPPSDVTFVPWNSSLRRRSNARPRAAFCTSPDVASIRGTRHRPYRPDDLSRIDAYGQCQTQASGKCGFKAIEKRLCALARPNAPTRRLMTTPGVGAIAALTFAAAMDDPARFRSSRMGGAFWSDAAQAPVRRDRCEGAHLPDRGSWCARGPLGGCQRDPHAGCEGIGSEELGPAGRPTGWHEEGEGGAGPQVGCRVAPDAGRRHPVYGPPRDGHPSGGGSRSDQEEAARVR